jgi:hypothetical protein
MLPPVMLPVADTCPVVRRLATVTLPEADNIPEIAAPVELKVATKGVPLTPIVTGPLGAETSTFDAPLKIFVTARLPVMAVLPSIDKLPTMVTFLESNII